MGKGLLRFSKGTAGEELSGYASGDDVKAIPGQPYGSAGYHGTFSILIDIEVARVETRLRWPRLDAYAKPP